MQGKTWQLFIVYPIPETNQSNISSDSGGGGGVVGFPPPIKTAQEPRACPTGLSVLADEALVQGYTSHLTPQ